MTPATLVVNINCGRRKSIIIIFTKIIFAIELEFAKSTKFTARENFALYGTLAAEDEIKKRREEKWRAKRAEILATPTYSAPNGLFFLIMVVFTLAQKQESKGGL